MLSVYLGLFRVVKPLGAIAKSLGGIRDLAARPRMPIRVLQLEQLKSHLS